LTKSDEFLLQTCTKWKLFHLPRVHGSSQATLIDKPDSTQPSNSYIVTRSSFKSPDTWFGKFKQAVGFGEANTIALRRATIFHYEACTDKLDCDEYFNKLKLPDTVFSFFLLIQLHVWMCQVRSMLEGPEGRTLRNEILERMWHDLDVRLQRVEVFSGGQRKKILEDLLFHHQAAMISYDEGLLTDDKTLANALWRTLYTKSDVDSETLEYAVKYVRKQIDHLRSIGPREWCLNGRFDWAPISKN